MEVTKKNFKDVLPSVYEAISNCDFVAIDGEFSGLRTAGNQLSELDTSEERYAKIRASVKQFAMIQFGLSTFRYVPTKKAYSHATYCFYMLAKPGAEEIVDTSSMNFLVNNGFDFNKLYKDGIPYVSMKEEGERRLKLEETPLEIPKLSPVKVVEIGAKTFLKEMEAKISAFMEDDSEKELLIDGKALTGFYRKILYNNIAANFENILIQSATTDAGVRNIVVRKFNSITERLKYLEEDRQRHLDEKTGFTHVIRKILESNKPIVGHNCILDIGHMFEKFVMPLPETLEMCKKMIEVNFPTTYDTKMLAKDPPFCADIPITGLELLYGDLFAKYHPPDFVIEPNHESYEVSSTSKAHDAGFDAFMTGVCFATMVKTIDGPSWAKKSVVKSKHLAKYANRLNNMHSYDIPYLNLGGPEIQPDRSKVFVVECPESWSSSDVYGLFSMMNSLKLVWINSKSLYVIPTEEIDLKTCRKHLKAMHAVCPPLVHVRMYNDTHGAKRKSELDNSPEVGQRRPMEFKRLKSVGSSQMSEMSLESPTADDAHKIVIDDVKGKAEPRRESSDGVFNVPDDW